MSKAKPKRSTRKCTDDSLSTEREKVDVAVGAVAEVELDLMVSGIREEADLARTQQRLAHDAKRVAANPGLAAERRAADATLAGERKDIDAARQSERTLRWALDLAREFSVERASTDFDLACERASTELELQNSKWLLTREKAAHDDTRSALTTRDEFLAIVGHDLRSPLSAVQAGALLLAQEQQRANPESAAHHLVDGILRNVGSMLRLIGDLFDVERIASGKLEVLLRPNDLRKLIKQAQENAQSLVLEKDLTLTVELPDEPVVVRCDAGRIGQVLANLIGNAIKFTSPGGSIVVTAWRSTTWTQVSVGDTGAGIPPEARSRIFERFSQLPSKDRSGLGLGLYIAKSIITAHDGRLTVASAVGEGSVFTFALRGQT